MPIVKLAALACLLLCTCQQARTQPVRFPLKPGPNHRYLVDQDGKPFPILGRTAWFINSLSEADWTFFLDDCLRYGYNAVEMHVLNHDARGNHPPFNGQGEPPFLNRLDGKPWNGNLKYVHPETETPDFTSPNERYWSMVDRFLHYAESKGILVFLFPVYVGYPGTDQGWMQELTYNGADRARTFGAWMAHRYKHRGNLVWMLLGDRSTLEPMEQAAEAGLVAGLKSVPGQQSIHYSAECEGNQCSADHPVFGKEMTLNGAYSWSQVARSAHDAYAHEPAMPAYLLEEPYDEEGPDGNHVCPYAIQPVRRYQWLGWLGTIGGYISGNGYVWPFRPEHWKDHLATQNTRNMKVLNEFIRSIPWWTLMPTGHGSMINLVPSNAAEVRDSDFVAAAASPDGSLLVAYIPPAKQGQIKIDLSRMKGNVNMQWFDPTSGNYKNARPDSVSADSSTLFTTPGLNQAGDRDWVLVVRRR